jgi:hypothetical protein
MTLQPRLAGTTRYLLVRKWSGCMGYSKIKSNRFSRLRIGANLHNRSPKFHVSNGPSLDAPSKSPSGRIGPRLICELPQCILWAYYECQISFWVRFRMLYNCTRVVPDQRFSPTRSRHEPDVSFIATRASCATPHRTIIILSTPNPAQSVVVRVHQ